jgi:hypothetical protein
MFVHLGGDVVVDARDVVAILDLARMQRAPDARALVTRAAAADPAAGASARTLVVTVRGLHLSPLASETVGRRIAQPANIRGRSTAEM